MKLRDFLLAYAGCAAVSILDDDQNEIGAYTTVTAALVDEQHDYINSTVSVWGIINDPAITLVVRIENEGESEA